MEARRLYRSRTDRMIAGVAGGLGDYLSIDPLIIRILFVVFALTGGSGIFLYILAWILIPEEPAMNESSVHTHKNDSSDKGASMEEKVTHTVHETKESHSGGRNMGGLILIVLGIIFLIENLTPINVWGNYWPLILIAIGISIMVRRNDKE